MWWPEFHRRRWLLWWPAVSATAAVVGCHTTTPVDSATIVGALGLLPTLLLGPIPPLPYPTSSWTRPKIRGQQPPHGILGSGPRPQAYSADVQQVPTDIETAMHTLWLNPQDPNWYMDIGATSHMTSSQGNFKSYFHLSNSNGILVKIGQSIPILGYGDSSLSSPDPPVDLKNVLHAPKLTKNLIFVRKFTTDNYEM